MTLDGAITPLLASPLFADGLFSARHLALLLWTGLALLTLALLILMWTRWGQAKPMSKCIALSVFAHILFIAYAYGTRLIFDYPAAALEEPIRLAVVASEQDFEQPDDRPREAQPWNEYASGEVTQPSISAPAPQSAEVTVPRENPSAVEPEFAAQPQQEAVPDQPEPVRPLPDVRAGPLPPAEAAPSEVPVELPQPLPAEVEVEPLVPVDNSLPPRLPAEAPPPFEPPVSTPDSPLFDASAPVQRLSELPVAEQPAAAVPDRIDQTAESDNRSADAADERNRSEASAAGSAGQATASWAASAGGRRRLGDGAPLPEAYRLRAAPSRRELAERYGATVESEAAVEAALAWLAANQEADGRWDASRFEGGRENRVLGHDRQGAGADADTGITGLALLAFLGAGQTHFEGEYRRQVQHGLEYLLRSQQADGNLAGSARLYARMYCHGIASLAVSEAYAMTGDYRLQPYVERAVDYTIRAQHPTTGGWRYQPGDRGDMSQFGWQVMALRSAELAGMRIPGETRAGMLRFMQEVSAGRHGGLASYRRGEQPSRTMTAEALACRFFLAQPVDDARAEEASRFLLEEPPGQARVNLYYWYYASLALYQLQDDSWRQWNEALQQELRRRQRRDGELAGSWDTDTVWGGYGGRVYCTAMAALCLEVYYRYLPLYAP